MRAKAFDDTGHRVWHTHSITPYGALRNDHPRPKGKCHCPPGMCYTRRTLRDARALSGTSRLQKGDLTGCGAYSCRREYFVLAQVSKERALFAER